MLHLAGLLDPFCCRVCSDVDPDEVSAVKPNDDEGIKQLEANSRDDKQIHGSNVRRVVIQMKYTIPGLAVHFDLTMYFATLD